MSLIKLKMTLNQKKKKMNFEGENADSVVSTFPESYYFEEGGKH